MHQTGAAKFLAVCRVGLVFVTAGTMILALAGCATTASQNASEPASVITSFPERDVVALTQAADVIALGTVQQVLPPTRGSAVSAQAREGLKKKGSSDAEIDAMAAQFEDFVFTDVILRVDQPIKGDPVGTMTQFRVPGGTVGDSVFNAPGYPTFSRGEQVLVFLGNVFDGSLEIMAVYRIDGNNATSSGMGHDNTTTLDVLTAEIDAHKAEPNPRAAPEGAVEEPEGTATEIEAAP